MDRLRASTSRWDKSTKALLFAVGALALVAIGLLLLGYIRKNLTNETLYDFYYPDRYAWWESWRMYFSDRVLARLFQGVSISALYESIGYNPPIFYFVMLLMQIATAALLAGLARYYLRPWMLAATVVALAVLPLGLQNTFAFQVFAWLYGALAAFLLHQYITRKQRLALLGCVLAFMVTLLTSEAMLAILFVAIPFALNSFQDRRDLLRSLFLTSFITAATFLGALIIQGTRSGRLASLVSVTLLDRLVSLLSSFGDLLAAIWNGTFLAIWSAPEIVVLMIYRGLLLASFVLVILGLIEASKRRSLLALPINDFRVVSLLGGLVFAIASWMPYGATGLNRPQDAYLGASIAVLLLAVAAAVTVSERYGQRYAMSFLALVVIFWVGVGATQYLVGLQRYGNEERKLARFVVSAKQIMPQVRENTTFFFVNASLGRTGCIGVMNMLYDRFDLGCAHLLDSDTQETYTREPGYLIANTGEIYAEDLVILTIDADGNAQVLESIEYGEYPLLPITWNSKDPILTDYDRILDNWRSDESTPFYEFTASQPR